MATQPVDSDNSNELISLMADLEGEKVLDLVKQRIADGENPFSIVEECRIGLEIVGDKYEKREYYLAGLIMAGEIFQEVMELLDAVITEKYKGNELGTILIGTVAGDIHNIGKNTISMLLTSYGFTVIDLGVDVPAEEFLIRAEEYHPHIIGLSGLLTTSIDMMKETIRIIRTSDDPTVTALPIIVGGGLMNAEFSQYIGTEYWANDVMQGVHIIKEILKVK